MASETKTGEASSKSYASAAGAVSTATSSKTGPKPKKEPWVPSEAVTGKVGAIFALIEALEPRARGYALSRIQAAYFPKGTAVKSGVAGKTGGKPLEKPSEANRMWHDSEEYKEFVKHLPGKGEAVKDFPADRLSAYKAAQEAAFRKKSEIAKTLGIAEPARKAPAESAAEGGAGSGHPEITGK